MADDGNNEALLLQSIQDSRTQARNCSLHLLKLNTRFLIASLVTSTLATILGGWATAQGGAIVGKGPEGWRLTCGAVTFFAALSSLMMGFQQRLSITDRLTKATGCLGRLQSLELAIKFKTKEIADVAREYESVVADNEDCLL